MLAIFMRVFSESCSFHKTDKNEKVNTLKEVILLPSKAH